jgi:alkylhydroperoxidase family enzyme
MLLRWWLTDTAGRYGVRMSPVVWEVPMSVTPLEKQQVSGSAVAVYEGLEKQHGKVINFFKVLAYKPEILRTFLEFYQEVWREGKLPAVTKELAYLRTSILNGCAY